MWRILHYLSCNSIFICINAVFLILLLFFLFFLFLTIFLLLTLLLDFFNRPTISHVYNLMAMNCTIKVENVIFFSLFFVLFDTKPSTQFIRGMSLWAVKASMTHFMTLIRHINDLRTWTWAFVLRAMQPARQPG